MVWGFTLIGVDTYFQPKCHFGWRLLLTMTLHCLVGSINRVGRSVLDEVLQYPFHSGWCRTPMTSSHSLVPSGDAGEVRAPIFDFKSYLQMLRVCKYCLHTWFPHCPLFDLFAYRADLAGDKRTLLTH